MSPKVYANYRDILLGPSTPTSVSSTTSNTSIEISFVMPPMDTIVSVAGTGPTALSQNSSGTSVSFTNIVLGSPYDFTVFAIDSNEVMSEVETLLNVTGTFYFDLVKHSFKSKNLLSKTEKFCFVILFF